MIIYWLKHRGTYFPVHQGDSLLGRSPECLIVLASERVSREHAVVRRIHCGLEIEDLGSRNGTWVNGERIRRATVLQQGDQVSLGEDELEVVLKPNARVPVTVSGVPANLDEVSTRQKQVLEQLESAVAQLAPRADRATVVADLREAIEQWVQNAGALGVGLSGEESGRLASMAKRLAAWAEDSGMERWSTELGARLARGARPTH